MGQLPETATASRHFMWLCLPSNVAMLWANGDHVQLDASWALRQSNLSRSPTAALLKAIHWCWQGVSLYQCADPLCMLMVCVTEDCRRDMRVFNRRYVDWLYTVQDERLLQDWCRPMSTVIRLDNVHMAAIADSLSRGLNCVTTHGGVRRGLMGHVPATHCAMVRLDGQPSTWSDQFGTALPRTLPAGRRAAVHEQTGGDWQMADGETEITIRVRRN